MVRSNPEALIQSQKVKGTIKSVTIPSFQNMKLLSFSDEGANTFSASWQGEEVVIKKCDIWKRPLITEELEHEARIYKVLSPLQGKWIPIMKIAGILNGIDMVLVTKHWGHSICNMHLSSSDCDEIRAALSKIHQLGILHGDIRTENILFRQDGNVRCFSIIDFGFSKFTS
ncbi:hypothetical protein BGZ76_006847, partial [Entomortierella beljakovae]